ncbi:MAG TPA: DNA alkylation repair protein [Chryseosolibacter sp.]
MADALKHMYNPGFFEKLCPVMRATIPKFDCQYFIHRIFNNQWPELELKQRVRHIAVTLHDFLPHDFPAAASILVSLSHALRRSEVTEQGFATIFIPEYVHVYGLEHPEESLDALEEITQLVSAEFAVRPFLIQYPDLTMQRMKEWSKHSNANVRRLSSEGCRPRLPWAMGIPTLKKDPAPILPILENLKADPSEYVRRSVANNLNDIAKDHPNLVLTIAKKWLGKNEDTNRIIKHGCRTLLKKGNEQVLGLHGYNPKSRGVLKAFELPKTKVKIGDQLNFSLAFVNKERTATPYRLEYAIDYLTSTGKRSWKIFKITENELEAGESITLVRKQSFKNLTTRKHFKGKHRLTILSNGKKVGAKEFMVC